MARSTHLEPLRLVELDSSFVLDHVSNEDIILHLPRFVEDFFLAIHAANCIDVPVVFQVL